MMDAGARHGVWDDFEGKPAPTRMNGSDQAWVSWYLGEGEAVFNQKDGVYYQRNYTGQDNACIVYLSGRSDPRYPPWSEMEWVQKNYR